MDEPCILDMKIGRRLYDDDATPEKTDRMKLKSENSTSGSVGFRISGMRVHLFCREINMHRVWILKVR
jgi:1D-myo-inositol-tetrakisphosphate 5-kinase/inositol-polyphosphate multikinase